MSYVVFSPTKEREETMKSPKSNLAIILLILIPGGSSIAALNTGLGAKPPKDAIVLFDGADFSQWTAGADKTIGWKIVDDYMQIVPGAGSITTRRDFRDFRMHIEFNVPFMPDAKGQGRGNSGIYIQRRYELQILDSYGIESKYNDCGAIYKTRPPDKNACKKPGRWQYYDLQFTAAKWKGDKKTDNARITVYQNGDLIHDDFSIPNKTGAGRPEGPTAGPILLQDHKNEVKFRNIWIVPLNETGKVPNTLTDTEKADGWKLLFDGKTSKGWRSARSDEFPEYGWSIRDGMIIVNPGDGAESRRGGDIITGDLYSNFELKVDFKLTPRANSGIKYFVIPELLIQKGSAIGIEYQLYDAAGRDISSNKSIASAYDLFAAKGACPNPAGRWNTARIVSKDGKVRHWLNGRLVLEYNRLSPEFRQARAKSKFKNIANFGALEKGFILLQDHGNEAAYRNIKIKVP